MRSIRIRRGLIGVVAISGALFGSTEASSAQPGVSSSTSAAGVGTHAAAQPGAVQPAGAGDFRAAARFAAQARGEGLSPGQAKSLQQRVDSYLQRLGGTQVSINKIHVDGATEILVALPGEKAARDVTKRSAGTAKASCPKYWFCAFAGTNYTGDSKKRSACGSLDIPWYTDGSWINNQSVGTIAEFKSTDGVTRWRSPAPDHDDVADWRWVDTVKVC